MSTVWPWYIIMDSSEDIPLEQRQRVTAFLNTLLDGLARFNRVKASEGKESRVAILSVGDKICWLSPKTKMVPPDEVNIGRTIFRGKANYSALPSILNETASAGFFCPEFRPEEIMLPELMYIGVEPKKATDRELVEASISNNWIKHAEKIAVCFGAETGSRLDELCEVINYDRFAANCEKSKNVPMDSILACSYYNCSLAIPVDNSSLFIGNISGACLETHESFTWRIMPNTAFPY